MTILNTADLLPRQLWQPKHDPNAEAAFWTGVVEAQDLFNKGMSGKNAHAYVELKEAMAVSDFNILLGAAFEVEMLATYEDIETEWKDLAKETTVKDFKPKKFIELFGGRDPFDPVGEGEEYQDRAKDEAEYKIEAGKFGNTFTLSFELIKNDELDGLKTLPDDLAQGAAATEDHTAFSAIVSPSGPNADFFRAPKTDENRINNAVDNKPLTRENLLAAYQKIIKRRGPDGLPIRLNGRRLNLWVPLALQFEAEAIVNTPQIEVTEGNTKFFRPNPLYGKFDVKVSWNLSLIDVSAKSDTTWYILAKPDVPRPAVAFAKMNGEENPDIRVEANQGTTLSGSTISPSRGSFRDDTIKYRGRHICGAAGLDPISSYASTGS